MSMYHKDKCTIAEITNFRQKVIDFLEKESIKPHAIRAFRNYNGEVRIYKAEPAQRFRLRMGKILIAFKNPDGSYEGENNDAIEMLKNKKGDQLWETTNAPIPCTNYTRVFRSDSWGEGKKAIIDFFKETK